MELGTSGLRDVWTWDMLTRGCVDSGTCGLGDEMNFGMCGCGDVCNQRCGGLKDLWTRGCVA